MTRRRISAGELDELMSFDHVIEVHENGTVSEPENIYAPEVYEGQVLAEGWELLKGYTGQYSYSGPVMHDSEYIGGRLATDILNTPGVYAAVVNYSECDQVNEEDCCPVDCNDDHIDGWAIARLRY